MTFSRRADAGVSRDSYFSCFFSFVSFLFILDALPWCAHRRREREKEKSLSCRDDRFFSQTSHLTNMSTGNGSAPPARLAMGVPVKKYPPLPVIAVATGSVEPMLTPSVSAKKILAKTQMLHHFVSTQRTALPTISQPFAPARLTRAMDLHEELPEFHCHGAHRAATYTSIGDRIISPIKRPSAPSPPASAQSKREGAFHDDDDNHSIIDDVESQFFDESIYYPHALLTDKETIAAVHADQNTSQR